MKVLRFREIDCEKILTHIVPASIDTVRTQKAILAADKKIAQQTISEYAVYSHPGKNGLLVEDETADRLSAKFADIKEYQAMTITGEIVPYYTSYWIKKDKWDLITGEHIGKLPKGGVLPTKLTDEQKTEIEEQNNPAEQGE